MQNEFVIMDDKWNLPNAMPEPSPAKTKISMEMNSANAALRAAGWVASAGEPISILGTAIFNSSQFISVTKPKKKAGACY